MDRSSKEIPTSLLPEKFKTSVEFLNRVNIFAKPFKFDNHRETMQKLVTFVDDTLIPLWLDDRLVESPPIEGKPDENLLGFSRNMFAMLDVIALCEGTDFSLEDGHRIGYDTIVGYPPYRADVSAGSDHPRKMQHIGSLGIRSNAAGRYQFLSTTWDRCILSSGATDFSPRSQDIAAVWLITHVRLASDAVEKGDIADALITLSYEWASLPIGPIGSRQNPDKGRYGQPTHKYSQILDYFQKAGGTLA